MLHRYRSLFAAPTSCCVYGVSACSRLCALEIVGVFCAKEKQEIYEGVGTDKSYRVGAALPTFIFHWNVGHLSWMPF